MTKAPAIAMLATAVLLVYSFFVIHPGAPHEPATHVSAADDIQLYVNGDKIVPDTPPQIVDGSTFVPIRWVAEALDVQFDWNNAAKKGSVTKGGTSLEFTIDRKEAVKNGEPVTLEASPYIAQERTFVPVRWIGEAFDLQVDWEPDARIITINNKTTTDGEATSIVGDVETFERLLLDTVQQAEYKKNQLHHYIDESATMIAETDSASASDGAAVRSDYSDTNVQVDGVDEGDVVKTDGKYIFQLNSGNLVIAKVTPSDQMEVVELIEYEDEGFQPYEIYVDEEHLVVIGKKYGPPMIEEVEAAPMLNHDSMTAAYVYERQSLEHLQKIRELALDGHFLTSRKVGSSLYVVTSRSYPLYYALNNEAESLIPRQRDSAFSDELEAVNLEKMLYHSDQLSASFLAIAGIDLSQPEQKMDVTTFFGAGNDVYASQDRLYTVMHEPLKQQTDIFQFALDQGTVTFTEKGQVPGRVLNQFSMDEHEGHFRIATTTGEMWRDGEHTSKNHLFILDDQLEIAGSVEDLAPGERIYAVRLMGERGYVVTFRNVDPLFVLDLANPEQPELLGELKIPGYSDYLHPYDEHHLLGFGMDTIVVEHQDVHSGEPVETAYTQGMKMSLFDITDVHNPEEKFVETIGDRGTRSPLLDNHKALVFAKDKNLLAFPVNVMEVASEEKVDQNGYPLSGDFAYQGAYVYEVNPETGFKLKTKITHRTDEDMSQSGQSRYSNGYDVGRILYIEDTLYSLSRKLIQAHRLSDFAKIDELVLPQP